jgi:hypothetical protein
VNTCSNCGSTQLTWYYVPINNSIVQDGRLSLHDISVTFYLGCERCSETIEII